MSTAASEGPRLAALMRDVFTSFGEVCAGLRGAAWDLPTDCPGWSVKDQLSHIVGIEAFLAGAARPEGITDRPPHVRSDFGAFNEADIEHRRPLPPDRIFADFRALTSARIAQLEGLDDAGWAADSWTPRGSGTVADLISIRILDVYYHEQDIRRAAGVPGNIDSAVGRYVQGLMLRSLPATVGKRAGVPEGAAVRFDFVDGSFPAQTIAVRDGRASVDDGATPTVTIRLDAEALLCFCGGRWDVERALAAGHAEIDGDPALGRRVLEAMAVTP